MAESASFSTEVQTSGGFRIEVSPDELTVTKVTSGPWSYVIIGVAFFGYVLVFVRGLSVGYLLGLAVFFLVYFFGYFFMRVHNLRCTREYLEVIDVFAWPKGTRTRAYNRADVRDIRLGTVGYSRYRNGGWGYSTPIAGLVFNVGDKRIPTLYDLRGREAQKIFDELQRLGFHISPDPAMR